MNPVTFADPYKVCTTCAGWVTGYDDYGVIPCGHDDYVDVCPSWSPVGGCACMGVLGYVQHGTPPDPHRPGVVL
jgi:hypothetical protein